MAVTFDKFLHLISATDLTSLDYNRVNRMKRIKGEEVLVLGCNKHFGLVEYENKQLREISNVPKVHSADIVDFEMWDRYLYSRGDGEQDVKVTTFGIKRPPPPQPVPEPVRPPQPVNPQPIVFKKTKYENFKRFKIDCSFIKGTLSSSENFEKIAVAAKGTRVYAGGNGLYIFEKDPVEESKYKVLNYEGNEKKRFFALKAARSGHLLIQEALTNDLVVLDNTGEEERRMKGSLNMDFSRPA